MQSEIEDDTSIKGKRMLSDIYRSCNITVCEPAGYEEVKADNKWVTAMQKELLMIRRNNTWVLVDRPQNKKVIGVKWVFRTKLYVDGFINKHKVGLVVKEYAQVFGVDYPYMFAPVARLDTIRLLLALATQKNWKVFHLDVNSAFLNGFLQEDIYVNNLKALWKKEKKTVYLLKNALYGLKQAPRAWCSRINYHLIGLSFKKSLSEFTLYVKHDGANILIISLYVDDLLVTGSNANHIDEFKLEMKKAFEMTDLDLMNYFLSMEIKQNHNEVFICRKKYTREILKNFQMEDCEAMNTPMNKRRWSNEAHFRGFVGCLMYLTATRPDILSTVCILSRFMHCASETHLQVAKRVVRYIKGTINFGVKFKKCLDFNLFGFSYSDWGGSVDDMKSTSRHCFSLGSGFFHGAPRNMRL